MASILNFFKEKLGGEQGRPNSMPRNPPPKLAESVLVKRDISTPPNPRDSFKANQDTKMLNGLPQRQNRPPLANLQRSQLDQSRVSKSPAPILSGTFNDSTLKNPEPRQRVYFDNPNTREVKNSLPMPPSSSNPSSFKLPFNIEEVRDYLKGLSDKSFPNPFPAKGTYPEYFPNTLKQTPISQAVVKDLLENGSKNKLSKEEQIQKFINYKKEVEFYKKYIQMNEAKKQKIYEELSEIKSNSFNGDYMNTGDGLLNREQNILMQHNQIVDIEKSELDELKSQLRMNDPATYAKLFGGPQPQAPLVFAPPVRNSIQFSQPKVSNVNSSLNGSISSQTRGNNIIFQNVIQPTNPVIVSNPPQRAYSPFMPPKAREELPIFASDQRHSFGYRNEPQNDSFIGGSEPQFNPLIRDVSQNQSFMTSQQNRPLSPVVQQRAPQYLHQPLNKSPQILAKDNPFLTQIK